MFLRADRGSDPARARSRPNRYGLLQLGRSFIPDEIRVILTDPIIYFSLTVANGVNRLRDCSRTETIADRSLDCIGRRSVANSNPP